MLNTSPILITKLLPPRSQDVIASENISPLFSQIKEKKLTTVTAGAGYRKTTLISQAIGELNLKAVWYRLDESDEDFITFLHYLSVGIKKIYPDYGNGILSILNDPRGLKRNHESLLSFYSPENLIRLEFRDNFSELNEQLNKVAPKLSSKDFIDKHPQAWKLVARIRNLRLRIQNLTEASDLVASYPVYNKISNELKDTLLRNPEHPLHTLLRKFCQERNPERLSYIRYVRVPEIEEEVEGEKSESEQEVPKQEEKAAEGKKAKKAKPIEEKKQPVEKKEKPVEKEPEYNIDDIINHLETGG